METMKCPSRVATREGHSVLSAETELNISQLPLLILMKLMQLSVITSLSDHTSSESEPQRALHHARGAGGGHLPEARVDLLTVGRRTDVVVKPRGGVYTRKLRVVEDVVNLPPQLQVTGLAPERDLLEERNVPVVRARQADHVLRRVAEIALGGEREGRRVEPLHRAGQTVAEDHLFTVADRERRVADDDEARAVAAARDVRAGRRREADAARRAAREGRHARHLPVVEDRLDHLVVPEPARVRQVIGVVDDQHLRLVELGRAVLPDAQWP